MLHGLGVIALLLVAQAEEDAFGGGFDRAVEAAERDESGKEKAAMRRRIAEDRVRTQFLRKEEASIFSAIQRLDRAREAQRKKGAELVARRARIEQQLAKVEVELEVTNAELAALRDEIGKRAASMVRLRRTPLADLIARAQGAIAARRLRDRLAIVLSYDAELVRRTKEASADARRLAASLRQERTQLEAATAELELEKERMLELREERAALLRAVKNERQMIERIAGELAQAARKLEGELGVIRGNRPPPPAAPGGFGAQKGRLPWPVAGKVEVPFGKRVDADTGVVIAHKGIDLRAPLAEPVRSVFAGRAVHRGWLEGYGRVVIVEHEGGYYSIYAHLESFAVGQGASVEQGQVVGFVGDSGSLKGPYLYLELREGKRAIDPLGWLSK